ncbi:hypothetical protein ALC57_06191 [Trachymyrmex cornetzi]|uniref:Uncharacterized protein n=1 Tax=Trachymyrmex cornetzi TaxID=471704 RepID=A0A151J9C2_9HYME|nr:hypothetical protein ALC57_06191 [Trachymyrmex cornetzi]
MYLNLRCSVSLNYYGIYASMLCNWSNYRHGWKQSTCYVHKLQITYSNIGSFLYRLRHRIVLISWYRYTLFYC